MGVNGADLFASEQPIREADYKRYTRGALSNYTVSYWSRNQHAKAQENQEHLSNRIRRNPGMHLLGTMPSRTDQCSDCDYRVRILQLGNSITVELDGVVIHQVNDDLPPLNEGYIGLRSMRGIDLVSYDDFKLWRITRGLND